MEPSHGRFSAFLFGPPGRRAPYVFVVLRVALGFIWLYSDFPRWTALAAGHPVTSGLAAALFGKDNGISSTYFFTSLETVAAILLILGLFTRLAAVWGVIEWAITGTSPPSGLFGSGGTAKDYCLFAGALALLLYGSQNLSLDALIAKRKLKSQAL